MQKRILLVEDDPIICRIYQHKLTMEGFQVDSCGDGEKALMFLKFSVPDLIILDLQIPKVSGVEVLQQVRARPALSGVPVIVFSNSYLSNVIQAAWKAGATKCISKSECTPKQMAEVVQNCLSQARPAPSGASFSPAAVPPPGAAGLVPPAGAVSGSETVVQAELQQRFLATAPKSLGEMRARLISFVKSPQAEESRAHLAQLDRTLQTLTGTAGVVGFRAIAELSGALEVLVKTLIERPASINPSSIRTVAHSLDFLSELTQHAIPGREEAHLPPIVLVLDDDQISRRVLRTGLEKANLRSILYADPTAALEVLRENSFTLIISDVEMPAMKGFDFCARLREFPANKNTPVVFVTGLTDFDTRKQSILSGGSDLIAKPFLSIELAVKALTYVLKEQFRQASLGTEAGAGLSPPTPPA